MLQVLLSWALVANAQYPSVARQVKDTLSSRKDQWLNNARDAAISTGLKDSLSGRKDQLLHNARTAVPVDQLKEPLQQRIKNIRGQLPGKSVLKHNKLNVISESQMERALLEPGYYIGHHLQINEQWQAGKLPVTTSFIHRSHYDYLLTYKNDFRFGFDHATYLSNLRKELSKQLSPDDLIPRDTILQQMKKKAGGLLKQELDATKKLLGNNIPSLDSITDHVKQDVAGTLRSMLDKEFPGGIKDKEAALEQLLQQSQLGKKADTAKINALKKDIQRFHQLVASYKKYEELRKKLNIPDLTRKLQTEEMQRLEKFEKMLDDPAALQKLAADKLPMSGLERTMMFVNKLNAGQHTVSISPLSLQNYLHTGMSTEIYKDRKYLFLLAGKQQDLNSIYDRANFTPLAQQDHTARGIRMGIGSAKENHTHVSFFSFTQNGAYAGGSIAQLPRKTMMVAGISTKMNITEESTMEVEFSRSAAVYNEADYSTDSLQKPDAFRRLISGDNFGEQIAVMLKYRGNFTKAGLDLNSSLSHIAAGYNNPGSSFLPRGTKQAELGLKKTLYKRKLVVQLKGNLREYKYNTLPGRKWQNASYTADVRLKLKNGKQLGLKYQPVRSIQVTNGRSLMNSATDRLMAEYIHQSRVGGYLYRHMFNTTYARNRYRINDGVQRVSNTGFNSMQTLMLGEQLLHLNNNFTYAENPTGFVFMNTTYNADMGMSYKLGKSLQSSSALTYMSISGWYKMAGLRQSLSTTVWKERLELGIFVDGRLNIQSTESYNDDLIRIDGSIRFNL